MTNRFHFCSGHPATQQLAATPELAMVRTVDAALATLALSLSAAHPRLGEEPRLWQPPVDLSERVAARIIRQARQLQLVLERYEALALVAPRPAPGLRGQRVCACPADDRLSVALPPMSTEQACLLVEGLEAFAGAVRYAHEAELADLSARRAEAEDGEAFDDLPF